MARASDRIRKRVKPHLWLIRVVGVIVPQKLRADWQREWEAELRHREMLLAEWDRLNWRMKLDLMWRSLGALRDALWMQSYRLEDDMFQDLRFGLRVLLKHRVFTLVAVLSLALGIGANTAIFSVISAVMLRPLPYSEPHLLVKVYQAAPNPAQGTLPSIWSYPRFEVLRDQSQSFAEVSAFAQGSYNLTGTGEPERLPVEMVSAGYFAALGIEATIGRVFLPEDDKTPGANLVALIGHSLWQRRFEADPKVIGRIVELDNNPFTIVGVLPPGFRGQEGTAEVWVSMMAAPVLRYRRVLANANNSWFQVLARLKSDVTIEQAQAEMQLVSEQIEKAHPGPSQMRPSGTTKEVVTLVPLQEAKVDPAIKRSFLLLLAAVGLVLLIACANTANLLMARAVARRKEFALRQALGAGRLRLIRQLLTESALLALGGGLLGVLFAYWGIEFLKRFRPGDDTRFWTSYTQIFEFFTIDLDWRVLIFNFSLALLTGLLFGLLPAILASRANVNEAMKEGAVGSIVGSHYSRRFSARGFLVAGEIALSIVLLAGAGLMIKSLARLQEVSFGFSPDNIVTMAAPARRPAPDFYERLLERVQALPGVESAAIGSTAPLLGHSSMTVMEIEGQTTEQGQVAVGLHSVSADYFRTLRIDLVKGRVFTEQDRKDGMRVALINQAAAENLFPGHEPVGKRIKPYISPDYETKEEFVEIVGVVGNARYGRLEEAVRPEIYLSFLQPTDPAQTIVVRSGVDRSAIAAAVRAEVLALDRNIPLTQIRTMTERAAEVTSRTRFIALLLGLFAGLALLLSAIGIYGVMAYSVSARAREVGIRIALGAQESDVLRLVLRDGLTLTACGLVAGLLAAWAATRALSNQLYEISASDPEIFIIVSLLLSAVAFVACFVPARRATKVDPMIALRYE